MPTSITPAALEEAWRRFLAADVPVATVLGLETAEVDNDELARLQGAMHKGTPARRGKAADQLRELLAEAEVSNALALDGLVAGGLDGAERYADALAVRVEALDVAARWHLIEAGRLVGNIGHDLLKLGRLDEARTWYERALTWDPTNPFVVIGLAEVHLARGDLALAYTFRDHLEAAGYPAAHSADFDVAAAKAGKRPAPGAAYRPDLGNLFALDEIGYARLCAAFQFDRNATAKEALRSHALACLMRGNPAYAYWAASLAAAEAWPDEASEERGAIEQPWCETLLGAVGALAAPYQGDEDLEVRVGNIDEARRRGDLDAVAMALYDPHPGVRLVAAGALTAAGDARCLVFIGELAAYERARGLDTMRPEQGPSASRLRGLDERRQALGGRPPLVVPEEGIEHPSLATIESGQMLSVMMTFVDELDDALFDRIQPAAVAVLEGADWDALGGEPELIVEHDDLSLHVALVKPLAKKKAKKQKPGNAGDLRPVVRHLLAAVSAVARFAEVMVARLDLPQKRGHFLQPVNDPRDDGTHDHDDVWEPSFDAAAAPPASEPEAGLFMMLPSGDGHVPERRNARLWLRDLRICYGLPEVDYREPDARTAEVEAAVATAFERAFRGLPPRFRDRHDATGKVNAIIHDGRRGYGIFVEGMDPRFLVHYPGTSRFREYELFQAMRDVCGAAGLAPVVHWYREGGLYLVNCWER